MGNTKTHYLNDNVWCPKCGKVTRRNYVKVFGMCFKCKVAQEIGEKDEEVSSNE